MSFTFDSFATANVVGNSVRRNRKIDDCDTGRTRFRDSRDGACVRELSGYGFIHTMGNRYYLTIFKSHGAK